MGWNTPDDWHTYWTTCPSCNAQYHLSEGGCGGKDCYDEPEEEEEEEAELAHAPCPQCGGEGCPECGGDGVIEVQTP